MKWTDLYVLLTGVLLNAGAQLALKSATRSTGPISLGDAAGLRTAVQALATTPAFWAAIAAYGISILVWVVGLSRVPVSQAYPLLSLGYVVNAVAAWWLLDESLTPTRMLGIAVIVIGVAIIAKS